MRVLRGAEVPPDEEVAYRVLFAGALHALTVRRLDMKQPSEAVIVADEAVTAYRRAAAVGADVLAVARELHTLSLQIALPELRAQAVAAAETAADLLRSFDSPAPALAEHLALRLTVLHVLALRLIEAGRTADAVGPSHEAVLVGRRAGAADGADVRGVAGELRTLSLHIALPELREQSVAAAAAAADLLRSFDPPSPALTEHLAFRLTVLHELVLRVIEAGRPTDAVGLADEAVAVGRRAGAASGANVPASPANCARSRCRLRCPLCERRPSPPPKPRRICCDRSSRLRRR